MPLIEKSAYQPPFFFKNNHIQTVFPILFRKRKRVKYERERIVTPDKDFIDLDWSRVHSSQLILLMDGLEGNSYHKNIVNMAYFLNKNGFDTVVYNYRGCSGEPNLKPYSYHAGSVNDLDLVINHLLNQNNYADLFLVACSFGGNMVLKYLGEQGTAVDKRIKKAACYSVPCDLTGCSWKVSSQKFYIQHFLSKYREKIVQKAEIMPDKINAEGFNKIKNFKQYDDRYTAPLNNFKNAEDYWEKTCCLPHLKNIKIPTLLLNAKDDPFLTLKSFPEDTAKDSSYLFLEAPDYGGHAGFILFNKQNEYWFEKRIFNFLTDK